MFLKPVNNIDPLIEPVYNYKYNYIRVNGGDFNSQTLYRNFWNQSLSKDDNKNKLFRYLSRFLHYQQKYNLSVKFDSAMEADYLYNNLKEKEANEILDWIIEWQDVNDLQRDSIIFLTNDINAKSNTPEPYKRLVESLHKYRFYCAPSLDINILHERHIHRKFYYNVRRPDRIRNNLFNFFKENNLMEESFWSYNVPSGDGNKPLEEKETYTLERYYDNIPDETFSYEENFAGLRLMQESFLHIVMETIFENRDNETKELNRERFFTEKTFKPIMACQPFLLGSNTGDLERLKSYGFKTFDKWWDESYDDELDDLARLNKIKNIIIDINRKSIDDLKKTYKEMIPTLIYNYELVKNLDEKFKEFQSNSVYTVMEPYEFPLSFYDIQEGIDIDTSWNIIT